MCGFAGYIHNYGTFDKEEVIHKMADRIKHRGPDDAHYYIDDGIALGFRRLSIIDLEGGRQPILNEDGSLVLLFNGEIYNYQELREELIKAGHVFTTKTDSETILHGYEEYGKKILDRLRGMFAFIIWNKNTKELFGARDIFGIKPFYYYKKGKEFMFGSEIKSFLSHPNFEKELDEDMIPLYLSYEYSPDERTIFKNVFKLPGAHCFTYKNGELKVERYYKIEYKIEDDKSLEYWEDAITKEFTESVSMHQIADVEVGCFLSSGVDSSYMACLAKVDKTFTVGFDNGTKYNEISYAQELSEQIPVKNISHIITPEEFWGNFGKIQYHMDEPQSNPSSVPLYFLCQLARQHVTVVLSGEGADEIYAGYEWYADTPLMQKYKHIPAPLRHLASDASQHLPYFKGHDFIIKGSGRPEDWFIGQAHVFEEKDAYDILRPKYRVGPTAREVAAPIYDRVKDLSELEKKQYLDLNLWLPGDILLKADKMSMAHSLELRVPYLDREVLREAQTYPDSYKLRDDTKAVLRTAANKTLPDAWANRTKKGFPVPIAKWLEDPAFSAKVRKSFTSDVAAEYFDQDKLVAMLADPKHERRKIWTAYTFLTWHEQFFEKFDA